MLKMEEAIPKNQKLTQSNWSNQLSLWPDKKRMSLNLWSKSIISVTIFPEILLKDST